MQLGGNCRLHYHSTHLRTTALHKRGPPAATSEASPDVTSRLFSCLVMHPHPCSKIPICIIPTPFLKSRPSLCCISNSMPAPRPSLEHYSDITPPRPRSCARMNRNGRTAYARPTARVQATCAPTHSPLTTTAHQPSPSARPFFPSYPALCNPPPTFS